MAEQGILKVYANSEGATVVEFDSNLRYQKSDIDTIDKLISMDLIEVHMSDMIDKKQYLLLCASEKCDRGLEILQNVEGLGTDDGERIMLYFSRLSQLIDNAYNNLTLIAQSQKEDMQKNYFEIKDEPIPEMLSADERSKMN